MVGGNTDVVGGNADVQMVPRHFKQRARPPAAAFSEPPAETGESLTTASDQANHGSPSETPRSAAHPADQNGGTHKVPQTFH